MIYDIRHGDCIEVMRTMADGSVDSIVTDPPYGLSFMGKRWDYDVPSVEVWAECLRVLKPGGHLLAFAGTRTQHRMAVRIEDAGFEIRDMIAWVYGSGFPKSHNLDGDWKGWGTALKPAMEPITVARKPLCGTVAENVLTYGTGAINVDGCRIGTESTKRVKEGGSNQFPHEDDAWVPKTVQVGSDAGRWPANLIHDGSEEPTDLMGSAARFFYCAKASKADRDDGMDAANRRACGIGDERPSGSCQERRGNKAVQPRANHHPTVKPTDLMRYLCRLVTPPGGVILDPFTGSGSTGKAAIIEGFRFVGIEREAEYVAIARERIGKAIDAPLFVQA